MDQSHNDDQKMDIQHSDLIDWTTFSQILEIDDDPLEREFSASIVVKFFEQAEQTFEDMQAAIEKKDLHNLSELGHFLKGSSAALGLTKVQNSCEKIQHLGTGLDESGTADLTLDDEQKLDKISNILKEVRVQYVQIKDYLVSYFGGALERAANA